MTNTYQAQDAAFAAEDAAMIAAQDAYFDAEMAAMIAEDLELGVNHGEWSAFNQWPGAARAAATLAAK
jgi:hypothetical protein